ncbi:XRE family transcriptional regulator [Streptomyces sp. TP-A0356]|uniref:helix-turn-helix domain-containing protein n=1 Tax=Streptomyces sp. TP-A0356 TaxID=1359208 RepID=UPI00099F1428|nr:XRE family transcriptional regulator [Streptomyces sp. TP-A0356]
MPRWKALPDELDPQVREFAGQLRRLVDRSGLSISAVADRTGYSKTSWERYLNGRLLAPKGAIVALAEVTGTNPVHLTTMWELAERAWSRSEMRHDMTMEAIRISQARAALDESTASETRDRAGRAARSATATPGVAGPAGVVPVVPSQPTAAESGDAGADARESRGRASGGNSWGLAGYRGPSAAGGRSAAAKAPAASADGPARTSEPPGTFGPAEAGGPSRDGRPAVGGASAGAGRKRRLTMFLGGVVGALVVIAVVVSVTGGDKKATGAPRPSAPSASANPDLPAGVKCAGAGCAGKDPEKMGCGGTQATTTTSVTVGTTLVEVRYSKTCGAAWARVTRAAQGDTVEVSSGGSSRRSASVVARQTGSVTAAADTDAYTPMVAVQDAASAKACVTLKSGRKGCTT